MVIIINLMTKLIIGFKYKSLAVRGSGVVRPPL